ncbi:MAG: hypothetical protein AABW67_02265 [Nanoarchaeota archaeon]
MDSEIRDLREDINRLIIDVSIIKKALLNETELTPWAKKELIIAREENEEEYTPLDEL